MLVASGSDCRDVGGPSRLPGLLLVSLFALIACGRPSPNTAASTTRAEPLVSPLSIVQPVGSPRLSAWDGVNHAVLISGLAGYANGAAYPSVDPATYELIGSEWARPTAAQVASVRGLTGAQSRVLVYDSDLNREVLAYGPTMGQASQGTWEWDGKTWSRVSTAFSLPSLAHPSAAYDPQLHAVVMIDTCTAGGDKPQGGTLLFDGSDWRLVSPAHWPRGCPVSLAYSPTRRAVIALDFSNYQTWRFDGIDWTPTGDAATTSPSGAPFLPLGNGMNVYSPSAAFDEATDRWVLFGGWQSGNLSDTWTGGDGNFTWRPLTNSPIARSGAAMVWDPDSQRIVLFGGLVGQYGQDAKDLRDTWAWNGNEWHQVTGPIYPSPAPSQSTSPGAQPSPCLWSDWMGSCQGRAATAEEAQALLAVGRPGIEAQFGWPDWAGCQSGQQCFKVSDPARVMVGTNAGTFTGSDGQFPGGGYGSFCVGFLDLDSSGWHYVNGSCSQQAGGIPGISDRVFVSGCANVRSAPGLSSSVIGCLANGTPVDVDSAPTYLDGHIWWHLAGRGWMAHDFLVDPASTHR